MRSLTGRPGLLRLLLVLLLLLLLLELLLLLLIVQVAQTFDVVGAKLVLEHGQRLAPLLMVVNDELA